MVDWRPNKILANRFLQTYEAREEKSDTETTQCQIKACKRTPQIRSSEQSQSTFKFFVEFLTGLCIDKERVHLQSP